MPFLPRRPHALPPYGGIAEILVSRNNNIRSFGKIIRIGAPRYWRERQS
jgi:hypothetical protein